MLEALAGRPAKETQISAVFVGEDTVWKLKKAVRLNFLDFTTVEHRRHYLERELALNGPAAPGLYRDVVPLTKVAGGLELGGPGEVADWVLRMARIPPADFLLARAANGLGHDMLDALGDMVAADHGRRPPCQPGEQPGRNARGNALAACNAGLDRRRVAAWLLAVEQAHDAGRPWLLARAAQGFVRRCHGDLHLGNICLWQGKSTPFDALEFNESMATIDTAYDLAFLLMDLERRAGRAAANRVLNRYVARTGDAALVRLLPAFLSRRAMVRAHVTGDADLLQAALDYLRPAPGGVVAIGGLPGTGKSTLARSLAAEWGGPAGALVVRSDELRKRLHGVAPEQRLPPEGYTAAANARVNAAMLAAVADAASHGVIADATFLSPALREAVSRVARPFTGIWLEAPMGELARRVAARTGDASDATVAVLQRLAEVDAGPITWHRVPADADAMDRCRALLP